MTLLVFGSARVIPSVFLFMFGAAAAASFAAAFVLLFQGLNEDASPDFLIRSWGARFWGSLSTAVLAAFLYKACAPLLPVHDLGARLWPPAMQLRDYLRHALTLSVLGAAAFWIAAREGLAGRLQAWADAGPFRAWARLISSGAAAGLGLSMAGGAANLWLFLGRALRRAGFPALAYSAVAVVLVVLPAFAVLAISALLPPRAKDARTAPSADMPALPEEGLSARERAGAALGLLALMALSAAAVRGYLRASWDFGQGDLGRAAGVPWEETARERDVLVLAEPDGAPGSRSSAVRAAAAGLDASPESLEKVRSYLERRDFRTLYAREGVQALRQGWAQLWDLDRYLDSAALRGGPVEPDYEGFLRAMRAAPVVAENYERLTRMAEYAAGRKFISVDQAQRVYQGFSGAYAHFGELKESNAWLDRVSGLLPLLNEEVKVDPIETAADCSLSGRVLLESLPPGAVTVGLFLEKSTSAALGAKTGLVDSAALGESGEYGFDHLTPGRYYLALQADSELGLGRKEAPGPGALRLSAQTPRLRLPPIPLRDRR